MRIGRVRNSVRWGRASAAGQAVRRARTLAIATPCLAALLSLAGCDFPGLGPTAAATITAPTPSVTATPVPWGGAPHQLPAGWTAYYAPHFSIALPSGWRVEPVEVRKDPDPVYWSMRYILYPPADPGTSPNPRVSVDEWDGLRGEQLRDYFCRPTANQETHTTAGLPMRFSQGLGATGRGRYSPYERDWAFITDQRTVYGLSVDDGPIVENDLDHHMSENRAIVETFAPQYTTWGCA